MHLNSKSNQKKYWFLSKCMFKIPSFKVELCPSVPKVSPLQKYYITNLAGNMSDGSPFPLKDLETYFGKGYGKKE